MEDTKFIKVDKQKRKILKRYNTQDVVYDMLILDDKNILLAGNNFLSIFNPKTEKFKRYKHIKSSSYLLKAKNNKIWIGSLDRGLGLLDLNSMKVKYFPYKNSQNRTLSKQIKHLHKDKKERLWIATTLGLYLFNPKTETFTYFTEKNGLPNNMVYGILEDDKGNLWLSTNKGISKFNPDKKTFTNFDASYGLQDNEFNTYSFFKNEYTGEMFFGGIRGLNSFYPERMKKNNHVPPIVLTAFKRKGKDVDLGKPLSKVKKINLNYNEAQTLTFEFVALNFFQSHKNQYAYKIEEIHQDWIDLENTHKLTLTSLNAGTYTLRIKGSNNHGIWNEEGLKIIIIVKSPFWETWWFISILVLLFLASVYGFYRWRIYQVRKKEKYLENEVNIRTEEIKIQSEALEKLNQTKDRLFSIIAHDLRSPMTTFESITQQLDFYIEQNELEKVKDLSRYIKSSSNSINTLLNNLLSWALMQKDTISYQPQTLKLSKLVKDVLSNYQIGLENYQIGLEIQINADLEIYADENALHAILRNLINNAIKFTPKNGQITVNAYDKENYTVIEIQDTGQGMSKEKTKHLFTMTNISKSKGLRGEKGTGLGLVLVGEFIEMHQGHIQVLSEEDKGTTIILQFPKNKN